MSLINLSFKIKIDRIEKNTLFGQQASSNLSTVGVPHVQASEQDSKH